LANKYVLLIVKHSYYIKYNIQNKLKRTHFIQNVTFSKTA